jgi:hypothetical protein
LIEKLHEKAEERVVILVDEYDKPLIDNLINKEVYPEVKRTLHDFYQAIKASDEHLRFVFLTGVSQFSGLSIFSGLNNLDNITMSEENSERIRSSHIYQASKSSLKSYFSALYQNIFKSLFLSIL